MAGLHRPRQVGGRLRSWRGPHWQWMARCWPRPGSSCRRALTAP